MGNNYGKSKSGQGENAAIPLGAWLVVVSAVVGIAVFIKVFTYHNAKYGPLLLLRFEGQTLSYDVPTPFESLWLIPVVIVVSTIIGIARGYRRVRPRGIYWATIAIHGLALCWLGVVHWILKGEW